MLRKIEFNHFRGFRHLELSELSQITLLTGKNSAGKSSVLEGIFLMMGYALPDIFEKIRSLRGLSVPQEINKLWEPMFYNLDMTEPLQIRAEYSDHLLALDYRRDDSFYTVDPAQSVQNTFISFTSPSNNAYSLRYEYARDGATESGHLFLNGNQTLAMAMDADAKQHLSPAVPNTLFIKSAAAPSIDDAGLASWFGELELTGEQQIVIDALKIIDSSIVDVKTIVQQRVPQLFIRTKESMLPIKLSGDGMCKLIYLVLSIMQNKNSIILIDEIENGLHYSMQAAFWKVLADTAKKSNTQIIATSHSYECIAHAIEGISEAGMLDDFSLHRLERNRDKNHAIQYSGELLKSAVDSSMEVR